jgi:polysaccharide export outer membrane protein
VVPAGVVTPTDYVIGPDDVLMVIFWREQDLSSEVAVRPDGKISLPLLNEIQASGLTPEELRANLTKAANRYVEDPAVTIVVKAINSRKVFITGEVAKPGPYPLSGPTTVLQMIATAGGVLEYAKEDRIVVMRTENGRTVSRRFNYKQVSEGKNLPTEHRTETRGHDRCPIDSQRLADVFSRRHPALLLTCVPAAAQDTRPGRAYRGLFGPDERNAAQVLSVTGQMGTGYETGLLVDRHPIDGSVGNSSFFKSESVFSLFAGGISYLDHTDRLDFTAAFQSAARDYSRFAMITSHLASSELTARLGRRTTVSGFGRATYQPWGNIIYSAALTDPAFGQVVAPTREVPVLNGSYWTYSIGGVDRATAVSTIDGHLQPILRCRGISRTGRQL